MGEIWRSIEHETWILVSSQEPTRTEIASSLWVKGYCPFCFFIIFQQFNWGSFASSCSSILCELPCFIRLFIVRRCIPCSKQILKGKNQKSFNPIELCEGAMLFMKILSELARREKYPFRVESMTCGLRLISSFTLSFFVLPTVV